MGVFYEYIQMKINIIKLDIENQSFATNPLSDHNLYLSLRYDKQQRRQSTSSTKTRSQVSYSKSKPYKQKGTGRARRGSNRTPLRRGGGVIFGPQPRVVTRKYNKLTWKRVIPSLINFHSKNLFLIDSLEKLNKTSEIDQSLKQSFENYKGLVFLIHTSESKISKVISNLKLHYFYQDNINIQTLANAKNVCITPKYLEYLNG